MKKITKSEMLENKDFYIQEMLSGKIFIYPTDTVLGIGCVTDFDDSVEKIFELKQRESKPLLVIIPHIQWLDENTILSEDNREYIYDKLPGAYSFLLKLKDEESINTRITNNSGALGVRIPDNWFAELVQESGKPFITTSVNISGEPSCLHISDIPEEIYSGVDYVVESNDEFLGKSSTLIDMRTEERIVLRK